jgi:Icc-related predicted phosphoesterase
MAPTVGDGKGVRILAVSDLHDRLRQFDRLRAAAPSVDAVAIAGDLLDVHAAQQRAELTS